MAQQTKLALILIILWITAGCQYTHNKNSSSDILKTINEPGKSIVNDNSLNDTKLITNSLEKSSKSKLNRTTSNFCLQNQVKTKTDPNESDLEKESDLSAQEKIDQALDLCNYAQQMWEKGKLEEALINLDSAYYSILEIDPDIYPEFNQQKEDIRFLISKRILEIYASRQIVVTGQHDEIPITLNTHVKKEIKRLTGPEKKFFIQSLERAQRYRPFIVSELKKAGLPEDLSWLPLIESGFKIRALSPARALGLWQFIPSTGYKFGLNRNYYIDERLDPEKATRAAIAYLRELHNLFGDWTTALAAYNCGESRVLRIIRNQRINYLDNFWDLYQNLPRETSRYVPRFLATLHIVNNLDKYNIKIDTPSMPFDFQVCEIKKQVRLKDIAKKIGMDTATLKELNPELRYALLPPEPYMLKIPKEKAQLFLSTIDELKTTVAPPPMYVFHRVRRGETLSGIANKYKTSIRAISVANNIHKSHKIFAGKVLKIPGRNNGSIASTATSPQLKPGQTLTYTVRRGDNLWNIARKFGTTTKNIMTTNRLSCTNLNIGQTLYITSKKQLILAKSDSSKKSSSQRNKSFSYRVKSGDSPFSIAKKYKMDLNRLLALNHLNKRSKIFPGQKLIIE
ncbi:LysM peptidoglycan-binding domain-containing protein [Desulfobacula phenolica]|uniref:Membrane-bound lytic murein transglycosylase D n=1 Tax=Desulfobacula phenolica TaxID=90732 RepID=A0A1H2DRQ3_9BACT|nr:LysM peptidoglycan-binding domain-containing protein [Desulfobacula phenolica]SDT85441.1 membrane-bound lytic murein transglycosylase D [Desulfobacula phenolica]